MYRNIRYAFFQPAENDMITLLHFHLHNPIMIGNKKTKDVQFYAEVRGTHGGWGGASCWCWASCLLVLGATVAWTHQTSVISMQQEALNSGVLCRGAGQVCGPQPEIFFPYAASPSSCLL
jgi:hypothetical protein